MPSTPRDDSLSHSGKGDEHYDEETTNKVENVADTLEKGDESSGHENDADLLSLAPLNISPRPEGGNFAINTISESENDQDVNITDHVKIDDDVVLQLNTGVDEGRETKSGDEMAGVRMTQLKGADATDIHERTAAYDEERVEGKEGIQDELSFDLVGSGS